MSAQTDETIEPAKTTEPTDITETTEPTEASSSSGPGIPPTSGPSTSLTSRTARVTFDDTPSPSATAPSSAANNPTPSTSASALSSAASALTPSSPTASTRSSTTSRNRASGSQRSTLSSIMSSAQATSLTTSVRATAAGSRQVRRNWWGYIMESFRSISRTSKLLLMTNLIMVFLEVIVTIVVLIISRDHDCDKPLDVFLSVSVVRVVIACPLNVYVTLNPRDNRQIQNDENEMSGEQFVDKAKKFLDIFAILWFFIGNYMVFTTRTCKETSPELFYLSMAWLLLGYIMVAIPVLLCLAVIFCLPCVLVMMRILHVTDATGMSGASNDIISKIPKFKYKAAGSGVADGAESNTDTVIIIPSSNDTAADESERTTTDTPQKSRRFWFGLGRRRKLQDGDSEQSQTNYLTTHADDAVCSICLSSYEDGDELRRLWCSHHFHKECVDEWLHQNSRCPMCRMDMVEMTLERTGSKKNRKQNAPPSSSLTDETGSNDVEANVSSITQRGIVGARTDINDGDIALVPLDREEHTTS